MEQVNQSWLYVIHKLLKDAERQADKVAYNINADSGYIQVHTILIELEHNSGVLSANDNALIVETLERIYGILHIDLWGRAMRYIERTI